VELMDSHEEMLKRYYHLPWIPEIIPITRRRGNPLRKETRGRGLPRAAT